MNNTFMKKKPILPLLASMAYGTVYAGEFTVQHRRQLFCGKDQ